MTVSSYCVTAAVSNIDGIDDVYCDGSEKDGKINCSWFSGISHIESFHTHK